MLSFFKKPIEGFIIDIKVPNLKKTIKVFVILNLVTHFHNIISNDTNIIIIFKCTINVYTNN